MTLTRRLRGSLTASELTGSSLKTQILRIHSRPAGPELVRVAGSRHRRMHSSHPHAHVLKCPRGTQVSGAQGKLGGNRQRACCWQVNQAETSHVLYCLGLRQGTLFMGSPPDRGLGSHRTGHRDSTGTPTVPRTTGMPSVSGLPRSLWDHVTPGESQQRAEPGWCPVFSSACDPFQSYQSLRGYFLLTGPWRCSENGGRLGREWRRNPVLWIQYQLCDFPPKG